MTLDEGIILFKEILTYIVFNEVDWKKTIMWCILISKIYFFALVFLCASDCDDRHWGSLDEFYRRYVVWHLGDQNVLDLLE